MGQKYIIKQSKNGLVQIPIEKYMEITPEEVIKVANSMGVDFNAIDKNELVMGTIEEAKEHPKVATDTVKAVQIALDHLQEMPNYYTKLKEMEGEVVQKGGPGSGRRPTGITRRSGKFPFSPIFTVRNPRKPTGIEQSLPRGDREEKPYDPDDPDKERDIKEN